MGGLPLTLGWDPADSIHTIVARANRDEPMVTPFLLILKETLPSGMSQQRTTNTHLLCFAWEAVVSTEWGRQPLYRNFPPVPLAASPARAMPSVWDFAATDGEEGPAT